MAAAHQRLSRCATPAQAAASAPPPRTTAAGLARLQRTAGNRAVVQRLKEHAQDFADTNISSFGTVTYEAVCKYVGDTSKPLDLREGLRKAWNRSKQDPNVERKDQYLIPPGPGALVPLAYDSDATSMFDDDEYVTARGYVSDDAKPKLAAKSIDVDAYRTGHATVTLPTGYVYTSTPTSNLIHAKGFQTRDTDYPSVINAVRGGEKTDKATAQLMLDGLFDMPAFQAALAKIADEKQKTQIQFFLGLLLNEILGRSTSNLIEIAAMLQNTVDKGDKYLSRRFLERGIFTPTAKEHKYGIGGQKLSRVGWEDLEWDKVGTKLEALVERNQMLYQTLGTAWGATNAATWRAKVSAVYVKFIENMATVSVTIS